MQARHGDGRLVMLIRNYPGLTKLRQRNWEKNTAITTTFACRSRNILNATPGHGDHRKMAASIRCGTFIRKPDAVHAGADRGPIPQSISTRRKKQASGNGSRIWGGARRARQTAVSTRWDSPRTPATESGMQVSGALRRQTRHFQPTGGRQGGHHPGFYGAGV